MQPVKCSTPNCTPRHVTHCACMFTSSCAFATPSRPRQQISSLTALMQGEQLGADDFPSNVRRMHAAHYTFGLMNDVRKMMKGEQRVCPTSPTHTVASMDMRWHWKKARGSFDDRFCRQTM